MRIDLFAQRVEGGSSEEVEADVAGKSSITSAGDVFVRL